MEVAANEGAYVLRDVIRNVPLSPDGEEEHDVYITCVDAWGKSFPSQFCLLSCCGLPPLTL